MKKLNSQSGRSMVEMLGVLAIIGVLSVGGIAGYSLSMRRHRANQVVDIISKFALITYNQCQRKILDGTANKSQTFGFIIGCGCGDLLDFENTDLGNLPNGVTNIAHGDIITDATSGRDTTLTYVNFSDAKLCKAVASITETSKDDSDCNRGSGVPILIKIKQN